MEESLVRISELAKKASVLTSTIRHYTEFGLLQAINSTEGGHRLYDVQESLKRLHFIQTLTRRGKSLPEIRQELERRKSVVKILVIDDEEEVTGFLGDLFKLARDPSHRAELGRPRHFLSLQTADGSPEKPLSPAVEMEVARDGFTAGKKCGEFLPDLIILDLMLPGIDGFKVCRMLRQDPDTLETKILAITGYDTKEHEKEILTAGADAYLAKPFGVKEFLAKLETLGFWDTRPK